MKKGLFIGLTTVDIQYFVETWPEPNAKMKTGAPVLAAGGPAANAAIAFSFLGGEAHFVSCIGKNALSDLLFSDFKQQQVKVIDVADKQNFDPVLATVVTNITNSERTIITHHPELDHFQYKIPRIDVGSYEFIMIDGFYPEIALPLCQQAQQKKIPVILDGGSWKPQLSELLPYVNIAICSANFMPPACSNIDDAFSFTLNKGVQLVAVSRGGESIVSTEGEIAVEKVDAIDSLGAGDVLHGAFCWFSDTNVDFKQALSKAAEVASFSSCYKGTRSWMNVASALKQQ
ncbi:PfkB family carbohydrate kinase [Roseimarinus sediminis]|uniref:PfkB family carbohydrate kinase n=1 Tax=Roseimarinus sediminis TaxID=1610899 RepID=UPI003D1D16DB